MHIPKYERQNLSITFLAILKCSSIAKFNPMLHSNGKVRPLSQKQLQLALRIMDTSESWRRQIHRHVRIMARQNRGHVRIMTRQNNEHVRMMYTSESLTSESWTRQNHLHARIIDTKESWHVRIMARQNHGQVRIMDTSESCTRHTSFLAHYEQTRHPIRKQLSHGQIPPQNRAQPVPLISL